MNGPVFSPLFSALWAYGVLQQICLKIWEVFVPDGNKMLKSQSKIAL